MNRFQQLTGVAVLGLALAASQAQADPPGAGKDEPIAAKKARKEAHDERKEARKEARGERKEAQGERKEARKEAHDERKDERRERLGGRDGGDDRGRKMGHAMMPRGHWKPSPEFIEKMKKWRESRKERRSERREKYEKKWGAFAHGKPAMNEFRLHGWRMAKLRRMRLLAEEMGKKDVVERVDKLIEKEQARHEKALAKLKESGAKVADKTDKTDKTNKTDKTEAKPAAKISPPTPKPAKAAKEGD